jgi:RNA polymerase sigma-70 factor (sigma-E family)
MGQAPHPTVERHDFDDLVRDEYLGLLRFAYLVGGDHDAAEDAVAEALARTWPRWRRGDIEDPKAYVRRAIVNQLRGRARRSTVRRRAEARRTVQLDSRLVDDDLVERDAVHAALLRLPLRQRAAVVLRFYEDRSVRETADLLGISDGAVKTHVHRALEQLRAELPEDR